MRRARIVILPILALLALGAAVECARVGVRPEQPLLLGAAFLIFAAAALLLLRHAGLALIALAAPLASWPVALLLAAFFVPDMPYTPALALGLLPGFLLSFVAAARIAAQVAGGTSRGQSIFDWPSLCALAAALGVALIVTGSLSIQELIATFLCGVYAMLAVPLAASFLRFGEDFAARYNRARELRERLLARLAPLSSPRWGWSLSGVAVVLCALGYFRVPFSHGEWDWLAAGLVLLAAGLAAMRDWRRAAAALLACLPAMFLGAGIAAPAIFLLSAYAAVRVREGEDATTASLRSLTQMGAPVACAMGASALAAAMLVSFTAALAILAGGVCALVFPQAFAIAVEELVPRRATIESRYRVR